MRHERFVCLQDCGVVAVDEDGLCRTCGSDTEVRIVDEPTADDLATIEEVRAMKEANRTTPPEPKATSVARLRLPHNETDEQKRYSMPDPDALGEMYSEAYHAHFGHNFTSTPLTREQVGALLTLARGYLDLTTYELGQECCVSKLRDIWRARRAR